MRGGHHRNTEEYSRGSPNRGFVNVQLLPTPLELKEAKAPHPGKKAGNWSGPWLTRYSWESGAYEQDDNAECLE